LKKFKSSNFQIPGSCWVHSFFRFEFFIHFHRSSHQFVNKERITATAATMELYQKTIIIVMLASNAAEVCFNTKIMVEAFSVVSPKQQMPTHSAAATKKIRLYGMTPRKKKDDGDENNETNNPSDDSFSVNEARSQLESLVSNSDSKKVQQEEQTWTVASLLAAVSARNTIDNDDNDDDDMVVTLPPPPPVLTAADREKRLTEIQLLLRLDSSSTDSDDSDDDEDNDNDNVAVNLLWDLWYGERGLNAKRRLEATNALMGDPSTWKMCEEELHEMIQEYGIYYYTEPLNRLATLYFLQGRLIDSYKLCRVILQIKPWHFGALSGIVLVLQQLGNTNNKRKADEARKWAKQCLPQARVANISFPPFTERNGPASNPRRKEWVRNAVKAAQQALHLAEQRAKESLGEPEEYYNHSADKFTTTTLENTEDATSADWQ
jgi:hypothetical protein